jgi:hypothetical protein
MEQADFERRLDKLVGRAIEDVYIEDGTFGLVLDDGTHLELDTDPDGDLFCRFIKADEQ